MTISGADPSPTEAGHDNRVLVLTPGGRDGAVTCGVFAGAGIAAVACADMDQLCRALLSEGAGAAVVAEEALTGPALQALARAMAAQAPWSDFPLIILTSGGRATHESQLALVELGSFTNATLLERPLRITTLVSAVRVALRSRARQYELRAHLRSREQMEARRDELLRQQRRIAETLQLSLLKAPPADAFPSLEVSTQYVPAGADAMIGGDFYDVFGFDHRVALVVGDVVGKGLAAASHMAEVKFALRAIVREHVRPAKSLVKLGQYMTGFQPADFSVEDSLVAVLLAVIDTRTGRAEVAAGGAEPPILRRAAGGAVELEARGVPIGVADLDLHEDSSYETATLTLAPGDTLFLTTDGITEARRGRRFFGMDGLLGAIDRASAVDGPLHETAETIIREAREFGGGAFRDDVCLLAARWRGLPGKK